MSKKMKLIDALYEIAQDNKNITIKTNAFFRKLTENMSYKELIKGLNTEVEIIEDTPKKYTPIISKLYINNKLQYDLTPKEDKKIEKLNEHYYHDEPALIDDMAHKINEIIDRLNNEFKESN